MKKSVSRSKKRIKTTKNSKSKSLFLNKKHKKSRKRKQRGSGLVSEISQFNNFLPSVKGYISNNKILGMSNLETLETKAKENRGNIYDFIFENTIDKKNVNKLKLLKIWNHGKGNTMEKMTAGLPGIHVYVSIGLGKDLKLIGIVLNSGS